MSRKKICIITGSRAEWGLFSPLAKEIRKNKDDFDLRIIATGMHLSQEFGSTYKEIEKDGFAIDSKQDILFSGGDKESMGKSIGRGIIGLTDALRDLRPDLVLLLGDRFEIFAASTAAFTLKIPIAHIHGGELTEGAVDDAFRHSITKMSQIHFTSTEEYRKRVIQLGEQPDKVFNFGALGLDNIKGMNLLSKNATERELDFSFGEHNIIVTFHPVTLENNSTGKEFCNLLNVLDHMNKLKIIFTKANADPGGKLINSMIDDYVKKNGSKAVVFTSMGQLLYLSTLQFVDAVVGNSSSGIIEAPSLKIGTINIGDRQRGRIQADSVINCDSSVESIKEAFKKLYGESFQKTLKEVVNPYGDGRASGNIVKVLKSVQLNDVKKRFYDVQY